MPSTVVGLGDGRPAAATLAAARGLPLLQLDGLPALLDRLTGPGPALLVSGGGTVTPAELGAVVAAATTAGRPVGFVAGWGEGTAELHAATIAGHPWSAPAGALVWTDVRAPELPSGRVGGTEFLSEEDPRLRPLLGQPRRLAALFTHGNGVDAPLGAAKLCSGDVPAGPAAPEFLPCGHAGGPCLRSTVVDGELVPPVRVRMAEIAADVVLLASCYGLLATGSLYDPARSMATELARSPRVGALLTTYREMEEATWPILLAVAMLDAGRSLGEVCLEINRLTVRYAGGEPPWLLLGDPEVAFPAVRPALEPAGLHRLEPGVSWLRLPSDRPQLLTAEPVAPTPAGTPGRADLTFQQIRDSATAVLVYEGAAGRDYRLEVLPAEADPSFRAVHAIRSTLGPLAFTRSVLDGVAAGPRAGAAAALRDVVAQRLAGNLEFAAGDLTGELVLALSGDRDRAAQALREIGPWAGLNAALALFLGGHLTAAGSIISDGALHGRAVRPDVPCAYCGMPVVRRESVRPLTGVRRRISWCAGCGLLGETGGAVDRLSLDGPRTLRAGVETEYVLTGLGPPAERWQMVHACLRLGRTPWPLRVTGPVVGAVGEPGAPFPALPLTVRVDGPLPPGLHTLVAAVVVQGELWTCRRPVVGG